MIRQKVAILEDNKDLLKELKLLVEQSKNLEVKVYSSDPSDFIKKVEEIKSEIYFVILDIELGSNITGVEVAGILKLPTLFVSGKTRDFLNEIEQIDLDNDFPVESILKPVTSDKLNKILPKLFSQIKALEEPVFTFKFNGEIRKKKQSEIVFLETEGGNSNNKKVYFTNEKPLTIKDFSFTKMNHEGYDEEVFITPHQSYRVNKLHCLSYSNNDHKIIIECMNELGEILNKEIQVSENYRTEIKRLFLNKK